MNAVELLSFDWPRATVKVSCGSGFYVRSFVRDVAEKLGTVALMSSLKRASVGAFRDEGEMDESKVLRNFQRVDLSEEDYQTIMNGGQIEAVDGLLGIVFAYYDDKLVSVMECDSLMRPLKNLL